MYIYIFYSTNYNWLKTLMKNVKTIFFATLVIAHQSEITKNKEDYTDVITVGKYWQHILLSIWLQPIQLNASNLSELSD